MAMKNKSQVKKDDSSYLLEIKNLSLSITSDDQTSSILDRISFHIRKGEVFGLVGESGCGKSITALAITGLLPQSGSIATEGEILFHNQNLLSLTSEKRRLLRGNSIAMIFQEPMSALNPLKKIEAQISECFAYHPHTEDIHDRIHSLFARVGFSDPKSVLLSYPHELSGGMMQRVMIAMALALRPELIIADEPTTALDVTVQAQIMELLLEMADENNSSVFFITHNLSLIAQYADRVAVMYAGRIVEEAPVDLFIKGALHPYSQGLMSALPDLNSTSKVVKPIRGQVPNPSEYADGCRFMDRCDYALPLCKNFPERKLFHNDQHSVACHHLQEKGNE